MEVLVAYDVSTETKEGRRRLRRVAKVCEAHGERVQKSVFECVLNREQLEIFKHRLLREINMTQDSLRMYRLREPRDRYLEAYGTKPMYDIRDPLVI